jgi:arsenical pump membrane protein
MLALVPGGSPADPRCVLAALVGGDLGPRLFPMGSLAGLLWLEMLRRAGVQVSVRRFVLVGVVATLPALGVCLTLL